MDERNLKLSQSLVSGAYLKQGYSSLQSRESLLRNLLAQRQLPEEPQSEPTIRYLLDTFALMDSNNYEGKIGVGERESRIFSPMVSARHFGMGHGIGRSGDILANQPKAAGSSLIHALTNELAASALKLLNYDFVQKLMVLPLATGMALTLALLTLSALKPERKIVIWPRIDQKTCLKSIIAANLIPIVIELNYQTKGDGLCVRVEDVERKILEVGAQNVLGIMSTTSCFAPRVPDNVEQLSKIAKKFQIYHVVNNAYGIWCSKIAHSIRMGTRNGECTVVVQSTDKNFMVPVGGTLLFVNSTRLFESISSKYPGRATASPIVDLFITLLAMGKSTIRQLQTDRKESFQFMSQRAKICANQFQLQLLNTPGNTISMAMTLPQRENITLVGSMLYARRVMGHRVVATSRQETTIGKYSFKNYGSHHQTNRWLPYITFAAPVGSCKQEIEEFFLKLTTVLTEFLKIKGTLPIISDQNPGSHPQQEQIDPITHVKPKILIEQLSAKIPENTLQKNPFLEAIQKESLIPISQKSSQQTYSIPNRQAIHKQDPDQIYELG